VGYPIRIAVNIRITKNNNNYPYRGISKPFHCHALRTRESMPRDCEAAGKSWHGTQQRLSVIIY
jgi:hypothetical protein